jgi:excisionase family DNA binding protein
MNERLFNAEEVAERLRVHKVTVHRWIRSGRLPAVNLGGTSGYRVRGSDVEAFLWAEYGGVAGYFRRAAHAMYEAANAASGYAERFDNEQVAERSFQLRQEADRLFRESEHFKDVQGFYRPASPPQTLRELQPFMAAPHTYDSGNQEFQVVAIMVRDSVAGTKTSSVAAVRDWLARAEQTNPPDTEHGRLIRIAGPMLLSAAEGSGSQAD